MRIITVIGSRGLKQAANLAGERYTLERLTNIPIKQGYFDESH